jgi:hypothetical protein
MKGCFTGSQDGPGVPFWLPAGWILTPPGGRIACRRSFGMGACLMNFARM